MTYRQALKYLGSFADYEKIPNYPYKKALQLGRMRDFLKDIGNPQDSLSVIHIAGTKGKGSVCAFTAYILRQSGFRVGLYTSPHLHDFRERIRILEPSATGSKKAVADFEGMISAHELASLVRELKTTIEKYNRRSQYGPLSFFEVYTAIAFLYFKRRGIDFAVLETGLGGRLDATNTASPFACGITPISYEHVQKLGSTLAKIAAEKAGIIKKKGGIVVCACQDKEASRVIRERCKRLGARLYEAGRHIKYFKSGRGFTVKGLRRTYKDLRINLAGSHQVANASLAVGLTESLSLRGIDIAASAIRRGLYETRWPARCEIIGRNPLVVLDGAQNLASAAALRAAVGDNFKYRKLILVLGISDDKDIPGICGMLEPLADEAILTRANSLRAADPRKLALYFKKKTYLTQSVKEAKSLAGKFAHKDDLILVAGSLFVAGEYRYA